MTLFLAAAGHARSTIVPFRAVEGLSSADPNQKRSWLQRARQNCVLACRLQRKNDRNRVLYRNAWHLSFDARAPLVLKTLPERGEGGLKVNHHFCAIK